MLGSVDAGLHDRGLDLVDCFRSELEAAGNLLDGSGRQQFIVSAHGQDQFKLIRFNGGLWRARAFVETSGQKFKLLLAGSVGVAFAKQVGRFSREAFVRD